MAPHEGLHEYVRLRGFRVWNDESELRPIVEAIVSAHPKEAAALRGGKVKLVGFFMARVMAETRDGAEPELAKRLIETIVLG